MATGQSYYHFPQPLGQLFVPGKLEGYFNDLTRKTEWSGPTDSAGLPLNLSPEGDLYHFPISVFQKALGHWDRWLLSDRQDDRHFTAFQAAADWACTALDSNDGWDCWTRYGKPTKSPYSAMAQGQGISLLVRAQQSTGDAKYQMAASRGLSMLLNESPKFGICRRSDDGLILEEYPYDTPNTVLNGWIFALYGLYDFSLTQQREEILNSLQETQAALLAHLPKFDTGYWSFYDTGGKLASPSYHALHIAQLEALQATFPEHGAQLTPYIERFTDQNRSTTKKFRAVSVKVIQKLANPGNPIY